MFGTTLLFERSECKGKTFFNNTKQNAKKNVLFYTHNKKTNKNKQKTLYTHYIIYTRAYKGQKKACKGKTKEKQRRNKGRERWQSRGEREKTTPITLRDDKDMDVV